ncbi:MAG: beta/gamma crystallin-related protein [Erythrobacter sp.]
MKRQAIVLAAGAAVLAGVTAVAAQEPEGRGLFGSQTEMTVYRDPGFNGPAVTVNRAQPNMGLAWRVKAVRVRSGQWELCSEPNFRGECWTIDRDNAMFGPAFRGHNVQSIRPIGGSGGGGGGWGGNEPGRNPSLRGMAAQFYPAPAQNGYRVPACTSGNATANCAARTADQFCQSMGWRSAARQAMETVRRDIYLADVLCSNTGN